jgi:hypothetical protein
MNCSWVLYRKILFVYKKTCGIIEIIEDGDFNVPSDLNKEIPMKLIY